MPHAPLRFARLNGLPAGFVGFDPTLETVIVSHQGTDPSEMCVAVLFRSGIV